MAVSLKSDYVDFTSFICEVVGLEKMLRMEKHGINLWLWLAISFGIDMYICTLYFYFVNMNILIDPIFFLDTHSWSYYE